VYKNKNTMANNNDSYNNNNNNHNHNSYYVYLLESTSHATYIGATVDLDLLCEKNVGFLINIYFMFH